MPDNNISPNNLGLLAALGNLGGLTRNPDRQPSIEEIEDMRKWGQNLRDQQTPANMSHWTQAVGAILGRLGGLHALQRSYGMRPGPYIGPGAGNPPPSPVVSPSGVDFSNRGVADYFSGRTGTFNPFDSTNEPDPTLFRR